MTIELKIPEVGESITEVEIGGWLKNEGEQVNKDEPVVTLESEKATVELAAPDAGTVTKVLNKKGETAKVGEVIGYVEKDGQATPATKPPAANSDEKKDKAAKESRTEEKSAGPKPEKRSEQKPAEPRVMPAAQRALAEHGLSAEAVEATGPGGRLLKEDVASHLEKAQPEAKPQPPGPAGGREEEVVPMTRLRRTVAERLVEAQRNAALLTTFNEADMSSVIALRKQYG